MAEAVSNSSIAANEPERSCPVRWPVVRLFVLPLLVAAGLIGLAVWIGWLTVKPLTLDQAIDQLKRTSGGAKTADFFVGPAAKERYLAAQAVSLRLREAIENGMDTSQRVALADSLLDVLENHTRPGEGDVQHFVLLALARVWQIDPGRGPDPSPQARQSRQKLVDLLIGTAPGGRPACIDVVADAAPAEAERAAARVRCAAVLALGFLAGNPEIREAVPALVRKLNEDPDVDVRIAAASRLGAIASPNDETAAGALTVAMRQSDDSRAEVAWNAALSLAHMNRTEAAPTLLMLLDREQLARLVILDREADFQNPRRRTLTEEEQQRFLINAMQAAAMLTRSPEVQQKLRSVASSDPSPRVRAAGGQILVSIGAR